MTKEWYDKVLADMQGRMSFATLYAMYTAMCSIETSDRAFANQILSGSTAADFCQLFEVFDRLKTKHNYKDTEELYNLLEKCERHWDYIRSELADMSDSERAGKAERRVKDAVDISSKPNDLIE